TGPFVVTEWVPQQHVLLERNEDYATPGPQAQNDGPSYIERIEWRFIPDPATRWAALQSGEVHVSDSPGASAIGAADAGDAVAHMAAPRAGSVIRSGVNSAEPPSEDIRVRQAFIWSADVDPGIETLYQGVATRAHSPLCSVEPFAYS